MSSRRKRAAAAAAETTMSQIIASSEAGFMDDDVPSRGQRSRKATQRYTPETAVRSSSRHSESPKKETITLSRPSRSSSRARASAVDDVDYENNGEEEDVQDEDDDDEDAEVDEDDEDEDDDDDEGGVSSKRSSSRKRSQPQRPPTTIKLSVSQSSISSASRGQARKGVGVLDVNQEDIETEWDDKGETKIDKDGVLLGGRRFRIGTFTIPRHPTRHYMLAAEICRILNFRDSFVFFNKNPHIIRVQGTPEDKKYLEDTGILPTYLKRRPVSLATARSIFRSFGYVCVKKGKPIRDDYWVGDQEEPEYNDEDEETSEDEVIEPVAPVASSRGTKRARYGYEDYEDDEDGAGRSSTARSRQRDRKKQRQKAREREREREPPKPVIVYESTANVREDNKMYKSSLSASNFNKYLSQRRVNGFYYDNHTNANLVKLNLQPSGSHLERRITEDESIPDDEAEWEPVALAENDYKYALAVLPGQYQGFKALE